MSRLPPSQPRLSGHAIEVRLYAEDPEHGFLPASGRIVDVAWPDGVRVDTGIRAGDVVSDRYDPMLAKLIVHAPTRPAALARLREALDATRLLGVTTNLRYLRWLLRSDPMRAGEVRTDTLAALGVPDPPQLAEEHWQRAAVALGSPGESAGPWGGSWRLNAPPALRLRAGDEERSALVAPGIAAGARRRRRRLRRPRRPLGDDHRRTAADGGGSGAPRRGRDRRPRNPDRADARPRHRRARTERRRGREPARPSWSSRP